MNEREQRAVELLAGSRNAISKVSKLENSDDIAVAALVWALADRQATPEAIRRSADYLKSKTGMLSAERTVSRLTLVSRMAISGDHAAYLAEVQRIFGRMREAHPVLTDDRDMAFAVIVALSERDDELMADAEECYQLLGKAYKLTEGRQSMAHVLSLSPLSPAQKVARVGELRAAFKAHKISIGWTTSHEYVVLALLALDDRPVDKIAADVAQLTAVIKKQKGFGSFSVSGAIRLVLAATISTFAHQDSTRAGAVAQAVALAVMQALVDWLITTMVIVYT